MDSGVDSVAATGIVERALGVGDSAPEFSLANGVGEHVSLRELLRAGPVVITFYRGAWCPYCNLHLRAYQEVLGEIHDLGAELVGISPQLPDNSLSTAERNALRFEVLSDVGNRVARQFGIAYGVPAEVREFHTQVPERNGDGSVELPLPATYLVSPDRLIRYAFVNADYRLRAEPSEVLDALRAQERRSSGA
jgi:peroxiredoxin